MPARPPLRSPLKRYGEAPRISRRWRNQAERARVMEGEVEQAREQVIRSNRYVGERHLYAKRAVASNDGAISLTEIAKDFGLTDRQIKFAQEYATSFNRVSAAVAAGFPRENAT